MLQFDPTIVNNVIETHRGKRNVNDIKGINHNISEFKRGSIEEAILKLKLYCRANAGSFSSIDKIFWRLDEDESGVLN